MPVTTWELHYAAPRYPADLKFMLGYLEHLKGSYTTLAIDYDQDEKGIHVMVSDIRTFKAVFFGLEGHGPAKMTVTLDGEDPKATHVRVQTVAVLDEAGDGDEESTLTVGT